MLGMITGDASRPLAPPGALDGCHHASVDRHRQRGAHGRAPPAPAPLAPALGIARRPRRHPRTRAQGGAPHRVRDPRRALVPRVHAGPSLLGVISTLTGRTELELRVVAWSRAPSRPGPPRARGARQTLRRGSSVSRSPSPNRLIPSTVTRMASPGKVASHHAVEM